MVITSSPTTPRLFVRVVKDDGAGTAGSESSLALSIAVLVTLLLVVIVVVVGQTRRLACDKLQIS